MKELAGLLEGRDLWKRLAGGHSVGTPVKGEYKTLPWIGKEIKFSSS